MTYAALPANPNHNRTQKPLQDTFFRVKPELGIYWIYDLDLEKADFSNVRWRGGVRLKLKGLECRSLSLDTPHNYYSWVHYSGVKRPITGIVGT